MLNILCSIQNFITVSGYQLVVIEDNETPLASAPVGQNFVAGSLIAVAFAMLAGFMMIDMTKRIKLRERLLKLREEAGDDNENLPFTIGKLRDEISERELSLVSQINLES